MEVPAAGWHELEPWGFVLEQDKLLPSVASIIAGGPLSGSWWGHPGARGTYDALHVLDTGRTSCASS